MLRLESDIQDTKALLFVSVIDILVLTEIDGDWCSTVFPGSARVQILVVRLIERKNHTHVKNMGHTSDCLFGIY